MKNWIIASLLLVGLPACSSDGDVNLGEDSPVALGENLTDYSGNWQGYAEAYEFSAGSDRMLLRIAEDGTGYAVFGEGTAPPPATNPDVGYPAGLTLLDISKEFEFVEGVQYPLHDVVVEDRRIRLQVSYNDLWGEWCALQEPVAVIGSNDPNIQYGVLPYRGGGGVEPDCSVGDGTGTHDVPADCGKFVLSTKNVCACTASACRANSEERLVDLDAALQSGGEELVGTLTLGDRVTTRLSRQ